jgi:hypothetical protein
MLVCDEDRIERIYAFADFGQTFCNFAATQSGIDQHPRTLRAGKYRIAGTTAR